MSEIKHLKFKIIVVGGIALLLIVVAVWFTVGRANDEVETVSIDEVVQERVAERMFENTDDNPFGDDGVVRILVVGIDSRAGETRGHCDAIQLVEINQTQSRVAITAVPRGTFARLPGTGHLPSDYYVSKACELGGLQYGISEIERILQRKADYVVVVGFSEVLGILRRLQLPTTETLQFLRQRQGYAVGEPQRARNHSTFLKHLLVNYLPKDDKTVDVPLHYLLYSMVNTDLSFSEARAIQRVVSAMQLGEHPERIQLKMQPAYAVADIPYNPETVGEYVNGMVSAISPHLSAEAYSGKSIEEVQQALATLVNDRMSNDDFVRWAYENRVWLQIEDDAVRNEMQFNILERYVRLVDKEVSQTAVLDYMLEMQYLAAPEWAERAEKILM